MRMFRPSRLLTVVAVALFATLVTTTGAQAHTGLSSTSPAADTTVTAPIDAVELTFSGSVQLREVTVTGPDGASAAAGPGAASGGVVSAPVALTMPGTHTVTYAVTADDGHQLEGTFTFGYAPPAPATPSPADVTTPTATAAPVTGEPSEAGVESAAADDGGLPSWVAPALVAGVVLLVLALLLVRRSRARS